MSRSQGALKRSSWSQPISHIQNLCSEEARQRSLQTSHLGTPSKREHLNVSLTAFFSGNLALTRETSTTTCTAIGSEARKCLSSSHFPSQVPRTRLCPPLLLEGTAERSRMKVQSPLPLKAPAIVLMCSRKAGQCVGAE